MITTLAVLSVLALSVGVSALYGWIIWGVYNFVAPAVGLPQLDFLVVWGLVFILRTILKARVVVHKD